MLNKKFRVQVLKVGRKRYLTWLVWNRHTIAELSKGLDGIHGGWENVNLTRDVTAVTVNDERIMIFVISVFDTPA